MTQSSRPCLALSVALLLSALPCLSAQGRISVVSSPLSQEILKIFPELSSGYIDFSGNGKADQSSDLNEYIPESRLRDGQLQAQEILDFIVANWRFISLNKLVAVKTALKASSGAISDLIAIDFSLSLDEAIRLREEMGDGLYLTPGAYKEAMAKIGGIVSAMVSAYKKEGAKSDADFLSARDSLFQMIDAGYPLPLDLPAEEKSVLSTSMVSVVMKEQGSNPARTKTALRVLGLVKAQEAAPYLLDLAGGKTYAIEAMKALADIGYKPAIPVIAGQLKSGSSPEVRKAALLATGAIGGVEGLEAILDLVKATNRASLSPELLEASTQALTGLAQKGNTDPKILTALRELSGHERPMIRRISASGLGAFNSPLAGESLLALINTDKEVSVRAAAVIAANRQKNDQVMPALLRLLREKDLDPSLKATALTAVGSNSLGATGITVLVEALADTDQGVRSAASASLRKLAPANQVAVSGAISRALTTSSDEAFLVEGASLLAALADPSSLPTLILLLAKPQSEVKRIAAWALYRIRSSANPKVVEELQKLVTNENESVAVRANAVRALGAIGFDSPTHKVWQTLVTTTQMRGEKYSMLRFYAVRALGQLPAAPSQTAQALLRLATKDPDSELRKEAVYALKASGSAGIKFEDALAASFIDATDMELKVRIVETMADLGSERAVSLAADILAASDAGAPSLALKRRLISALAQGPGEESAALILDAARDPLASDYIAAVLEAFPRRLIGSIVSRRLRTESDKNILSVLNSLDALFSE